MIKSITVTNYLGESIKLELGNPERSGFLIKEIKGLGPVKANVNITELATQHGGIYNSSKKNTRNVVMTLVFLEMPTIEQTRMLSYKYFPTGKKLRLFVETDTRSAYVDGYIEANEPDIFSQQEQSQISIVCPDPFFYGSDIETTSFFVSDPGIEFEYENEGNEPVTEYGIIELKKNSNVYYEGDSETGVVIKMHALADITNVTIYNMQTRETMKIDTDKLRELTGNGIIARDDITINTTRGNKSISLLRAGKTYNILNALYKGANWFKLTKGDNVFAFTAETGEEYLQFSIESQIIYEGV